METATDFKTEKLSWAVMPLRVEGIQKHYKRFDVYV